MTGDTTGERPEQPIDDDDALDAAADPDTSADASAAWNAPPSVKERAGVQRAVDRLLDALAPERTVTRAPRLPLPVERYRTPRGCILQAPGAAVSVSWFPDAATDAAFGELQVIAWRGTVSRPGSAHRDPGGATIARELMLRPETGEVPTAGGAAEWVWRADDGTRYDTDTLATHCLALLEAQMSAGGLTTER